VSGAKKKDGGKKKAAIEAVGKPIAPDAKPTTTGSKAAMRSKARTLPVEFSTTDPYGLLEGLLQKVTEMAASGDEVALENLWMALNAITYQLTKLGAREPSAIRFERLFEIMKLCEKQLAGGLSRKDTRALKVVFLLTEAGCKALEKAATTDLAWLGRYAESQEFWPCRLAPKPMHVAEAVSYLERIGVGTKSIVPTNKRTAVESSDHWTLRAQMLWERIVLYRTVLDLNHRGMTWSGPVMRHGQAGTLAEARLFPKVLELALDENSELRPNATTRPEWWAIAKQILKRYWEQNPAKKEKDLKTAGDSPNLSRQTYAIKKTAKAFATLVKAR
jgi:hypothetical protein